MLTFVLRFPLDAGAAAVSTRIGDRIEFNAREKLNSEAHVMALINVILSWRVFESEVKFSHAKPEET